MVACTEKWYLFRIPIAEYEKKVGNIPDFKSIRFIRMFMTGFEDSVVLRFAKLELVRNHGGDSIMNWIRPVSIKLIPANTPQLLINSQLMSKKTVQGHRFLIKRRRMLFVSNSLSNNNVNLLLNEQSLSMQICNLARGEVRGVFKTMNLDLRQYGKLAFMYIHMESGQVHSMISRTMNCTA